MALGGLSLIVSALENYHTCATLFKDYKDYERLIKRHLNYLKLQDLNFALTLNSIGLQSSLSEPRSLSSQIETIANHLRVIYPDESKTTEMFLGFIKDMYETSEKAAEILNGGSPTQVSPR